MDKQWKILIWVIYIGFTLACYAVESMMGLGIILTAGGLIIALSHPMRAKNRKLANENIDKNRLLTEYDQEFEADSLLVTIDEKIAFSQKQQLVKIYKFDDNKIIESKIKFDQILDSEIKMDNDIIFKASRSNQIGGALIGGAIAGGVGAIIGASSPTTSQIEKIKSITLKLKVNDFNNPNLTFDFLPNSKHLGKPIEGYSKNSSEFKLAYERAEFWNSIMELAIKQTNNSQVSV